LDRRSAGRICITNYSNTPALLPILPLARNFALNLIDFGNPLEMCLEIGGLAQRNIERRVLKMKTILTAMLLALSVTAAAAQTTFYGPGGDYLGGATRHRNTMTFYDASGNFVGSSVTLRHAANRVARSPVWLMASCSASPSTRGTHSASRT